LKTILRLIAPLGRFISADGAVIAHCSRRHFARLFGYVPQGPVRLLSIHRSGSRLDGRDGAHRSVWESILDGLKLRNNYLDFSASSTWPYTEASGTEGFRTGLGHCRTELKALYEHYSALPE